MSDWKGSDFSPNPKPCAACNRNLNCQTVYGFFHGIFPRGKLLMVSGLFSCPTMGFRQLLSSRLASKFFSATVLCVLLLIEIGLADLRISEEEDDVLHLAGGSIVPKYLYEFCFVGCFAIVSAVHFPAMRITLANLWHHLGGIQILELGEKQFLFHFFNQVDIDWVVKGLPWTFNSHLLVFHYLNNTEDPLLVPLVYSFFWVQVYDLPPRLFSEVVAQQLGNFVGVERRFNFPRGLLFTSDSNEKLMLFCFFCGCLGHGNGFCPIRLMRKVTDFDMGWDISFRAVGRWVTILLTSSGCERGLLVPFLVLAFRMEWGVHLLVPFSTYFLGLRNLILGINLEGMVATGTGCGVRGIGLVLMLHDSEDSPLDGFDGKKRQRTDRSSVEVDGARRGLSLGWRPDVPVSLRSFSRFHIDVVIQEIVGE
ncbi:hypothetical protein Gotur_034168, partial [Gossypium turneri]